MNIRLPLLICLLATSSLASAGDSASTLMELLDSGWSVSDPLTVETVEAQSLAKLRGYLDGPNARKDIPQLPFGFLNDSWRQFKKQIQPDDNLLLLASPAESWEQLWGWRGYIIVRNGTVVDSFLTVMN